MPKNAPTVFQFKIKLRGITPMIWRRVQMLSNNTFEDLDRVIQNAMGWDGSHCHEFTVGNPRKGMGYLLSSTDQVAEMEGDGVDEATVCLDKVFFRDSKKVLYTYDFGDNWEHEIVLEKVLDPEHGVKYPICIAGKRAAPPEDCGGVWGYEDLLVVLSDPTHEDYEEKREWCGTFDPEEFDPAKVVL